MSLSRPSLHSRALRLCAVACCPVRLAAARAPSLPLGAVLGNSVLGGARAPSLPLGTVLGASGRTLIATVRPDPVAVTSLVRYLIVVPPHGNAVPVP